MDIEFLMRCHEAPPNFRYPLKYLARKHGTFILSMANECDQELASYASKVGALAVIASDTDFLIYEGDWRLWSSKDIDFGKMKTKELNRKALASHLGLNWKQMPLFGTLGGNDIIQFDEVKGFLDGLGEYRRKFYNLAKYVREQSVPPNVDTVMKRVFGYKADNQELRGRLVKCLQFYQTDCDGPNLNPKGDAVQGFLLAQDTPLFYQIWHGMPIDVTLGTCVDMREKVDFGPKHNDLLVTLILRMAGIIRYDRREKPGQTTCEILTKLKHHENHKRHILPVAFPEKVEPPPLDELTSQEPDIRESYMDIKYQLCGWVVSDQLDALALKSIPGKFLVTVLTLTYLVDRQVIKMFEADLFLQMAYDMVHNADSGGVAYPQRLQGRPFRLTFLYQRVYVLVARVVRLVGLDVKDFRDDPFFDGVLFHNRYESWRDQVNTIEQESIKKWRVYDFEKI